MDHKDENQYVFVVLVNCWLERLDVHLRGRDLIWNYKIATVRMLVDNPEGNPFRIRQANAGQLMKFWFFFVILTSAAPAFSQDRVVTIRAIDFYGHDGLDVNLIRAALPLREGDQFSRDAKEKTVSEVRKALKRATGRFRHNLKFSHPR